MVGRGVAIALGLSLALNMFLGGVLAGRMMAPGFHRPHSMHLSDDGRNGDRRGGACSAGS